MKKTIQLKVLAIFIAMFVVIVSQAQIREVVILTNADVTMAKDKPDINAGYDPNNQLCNYDDNADFMTPFESWMRWDLSGIKDSLGEGEDILHVEVVMRVTWNSTDPDLAQGFRALHLDDIFDFWTEGNGKLGGPGDNLNGITWNTAKTIGDFEDPANFDTIMARVSTVALGVNDGEIIDVTDAVNKELSEGNDILTLRMLPYHNNPDLVKKWIGYVTRQSAKEGWPNLTEVGGVTQEAPRLKFYIGTPRDVFSEYGTMGNITNYNVNPTDFGYWMVTDDDDDARLQIMQKTVVDTNNWKPGAVAVFEGDELQDLELSLKAKLIPTNNADFIAIFGYVDEDNFSYYAFYAGNTESGAFKVTDGVRARVGDEAGEIAIKDISYHDYKIVRSGTTVTAYIDDVEFQSITDDALNAKGKIGVGSHNDVVFFDDIIEKNFGVGVSETVMSNITLFPNPTKDIVNVNSDSKINGYTLYNIIGKTVVSVNNIEELSVTVNLEALPMGVYMLVVNTQNGFNTSKIVKK